MPATSHSTAPASADSPDARLAAAAPSRARTGVVATVAVAVALLATTANRLFLLVPSDRVNLTGGATIRLRFVHAIVIVLGIIAVAKAPDIFAAARKSRWWWVPFGLLGIDVVASLVVGIRLWRPEIVAHFVLPTLAALGALCAGMAWGGRERRVVDWGVAGALGLSAVAGVVQMLQRRGIESLPGSWLTAWDRMMSGIFHAQFVFGRAEGLDVNPNSYSFLGVVGLVWVLFAMPRGALRWLSAGAAFAVVALGQSRTAASTAAVLVLVATVTEWRSRDIPTALRGLLATLAVAVISVTLAIAALGPASARGMGARYETGAATVTSGASADANLSERARIWRIAADVALKQPLGTWSAPGRVLGGSPDNDFVSRMVMAGPIAVLALLATLVWLALVLRTPSAPGFGPGYAVALGLSCLTAIATAAMPFLLLGWFMVGSALSMQVTGLGNEA